METRKRNKKTWKEFKFRIENFRIISCLFPCIFSLFAFSFLFWLKSFQNKMNVKRCNHTNEQTIKTLKQEEIMLRQSFFSLSFFFVLIRVFCSRFSVFSGVCSSAEYNQNFLSDFSLLPFWKRRKNIHTNTMDKEFMPSESSTNKQSSNLNLIRISHLMIKRLG